MNLSANAAETARADAKDRGLLTKVWFWGPVAPLVALDLWSKVHVFAFMASHYGQDYSSQHAVWQGTVNLSLVQWFNTGTIWGLFQDFNSALVAMRFVAIGALTWFAWVTPRRSRFQLFVLGMILAGAFGNLYDNLTVEVPGHPEYDGGVRDFIYFFSLDEKGQSIWDFPAFNVADSCISVGALSLIFLLWRSDRASSKPKDEAILEGSD